MNSLVMKMELMYWRVGAGKWSCRMQSFWIVATVWLCLFRSTTLAQGQEEVLNYPIQEESDVGAFVGNVARDSQLYSRFSQDEFQQLQYSISTQGAKFTIDENTSTIRTGQVLDREKECEFNAPSEQCKMEFDVGVYKWEKSTELYDLLMIVHITVVLEDINDNSPEFRNENVYLSVPESVPVGHVLLTSGAVDADTGPNNDIQEYRLLPDDGAFRLEVMTGVDGLSSDLGIVVQEPLDRELQTTYNMQVVATDGGFPQRSGSVNITVNVQDVNDNKPTFGKDLFNISVNEDSPINVPILRLVASDPDSSENGALTYSFSSRTPQKIREQLAVDQSTGDVILVKPLDFEKDKRLRFVVEVRDHGSPPQQSQTAVIINVVDVNDNAPQIDISLSPSGTNIAESIEVGKFIAHVSLSDADAGANGDIHCSIINDHFKLEKFSDMSYIYKILLQKRLDFEMDRQHLVNVSCSDRGVPPLHNSSSFIIHVRDENDNAPIFSKPEYGISVRENMVAGVSVFQVIAMDPDSEHNGNITYSLLDNPESAFSIDPVSGILRAMMKFDRETRSSYKLLVQARDRGNPAMSSSAIVNVDIEDVNDSPTNFVQPHFEFYVDEEQPKGMVVDTLRVHDLDDQATGQLQFSFLPDHMPPPEFDIDVYTGRIATTRPLDREGGDNIFDFKVFVVDAENVMFNDTASVTVKVRDINDHAPNISYPNKNNYTVTMQYTVPAGTIVARVIANDQDQGMNGNDGIGYSIQGDSKDMFLMNGVTGELILTRRLESSDVQTYHLQVFVQDSGEVVQMTTMAPLDVAITLSNASGLFASGGKADHNVAIVITLVCVTVALALAVLATICIIRRIDRERKHHTNAKVEEQNIYKQETLPPATMEEKSPSMENYENEIEKLKRKIKRELSFVSDDEDMQDSSSMSKGTSFSTFKKTSPGSTMDHNVLSTPQASSSVLSQDTGAGVKRVHYVDKTREQLNRMAADSMARPASPALSSPTGSSWPHHQHPRTATTGLTVRTEGEDAGSHTSGSTSDSGRGGSSEDDAHSHACVGSESGDDLRSRGYFGNPSLSTFRSPNSARPERSLLSSLSSCAQQAQNSDLNTTLTANSPRSYLQAQGAGSANYNRNISFSDDSITANTTVDARNRSLLQRPLQTPQQEQQGRRMSSSSSLSKEETGVGGGGGGGSGAGAPPPPRGILCNRDGQSRYGTQPPSPSHARGPYAATNLSKSLPYRRQQTQPQSSYHHKLQQQQPRYSPPLTAPPDVSPLENRSGDDIYGVRGKVVNFSVADSYQMTPRRAGSSSSGLDGSSAGRHPAHSSSSSPYPSLSSGVSERERGDGEGSGGSGDRGGSPVYVNRTAAGQSSLGQPYSLTDVDDVLCAGDQSAAGTTLDEEDRTTTTSGSYTINADDLCHEIDNLFFNDVVV